MKLYYTATSPFVRKVLLCAHELGIASRIETVVLRPSPLQSDPVLSQDNPLNKIPALVTDEGSLYDSPVICEYLTALVPGQTLLPASGPARWRALRTQALCDGILDAGILVFYERLQRPRELWWPAWLDGQTEKALQGLDALERDAQSFGPQPDLAQIAAGATLGWLEFRNALGDLRPSRPALFRWYDRFRDRPSMRATEPHA